MSKANMVKCPNCSEPIVIEDEVEIGEVIYCSSCETELEITGENPVKVREFGEIGGKTDLSEFRDFYSDDEHDSWE